MSSEAILPPEGPEGPKKQLEEEANPLLSKSTDKCNRCADESVDATETSQTAVPGDPTTNKQDHMISENHTRDDLVRRISGDVLPSCPACLQVHRTSARSFCRASDHSGVTGEPPTHSIQTELLATAKIDTAITR
ncbi:myoD family inhibitor domain-containing protein isoform X4 [Danio rerio]|uniref:MyoD family inhibitor domain-containing protein isoform X4 n=2 Tax=Danio rerio TaxID=7955 RepID=A0AC58J4X6_DANRE